MDSGSQASTSTKKGGLSSQVSSSGSSNSLTVKLVELDKLSDILAKDSASAPSSRALQYMFALWKWELNNQRDELTHKRANAEIEFRHEEQLRMLDIQWGQEELHKITQ